MSTAFSWCSTSMGYFISSVLVSLCNWATGKLGHPWRLGGNDLNHARLDLFYSLLCILNLIFSTTFIGPRGIRTISIHDNYLPKLVVIGMINMRDIT
jgi:hypothetical protein